MASRAVTFFYRLMHYFLGIELGMAQIAEFGHILDRLELVLACGLVTEDAVAGCSRTMNELVLTHGGVAFVCHARFLLCGLGSNNALAQHK